MDVTIVEMGVEEKMAPEDQHGGYSHAADERATWAQQGGSKNEVDISSVMAYLRQQG